MVSPSSAAVKPTESFSTAAGHDALEESNSASRVGHGLAARAVQPQAASQEFTETCGTGCVGHALHVRVAVEQQVEGQETKSVGLSESTHGRVQIEDPRSAMGAHCVQLGGHQAGTSAPGCRSHPVNWP
jgi:hypothetical protein